MALTKEQVEKIAKLAKLRFTDPELEKYAEELSKILAYVDLLQEVDTDDVEITSQVTGLLNVHFGDLPEDKMKTFKEGIEDACLEVSSQKKELHQIKVPKVL